MLSSNQSDVVRTISRTGGRTLKIERNQQTYGNEWTCLDYPVFPFIPGFYVGLGAGGDRLVFGCVRVPVIQCAREEKSNEIRNLGDGRV